MNSDTWSSGVQSQLVVEGTLLSPLPDSIPCTISILNSPCGILYLLKSLDEFDL